MTEQDKIISGSCACGAVAFEVSGPYRPIVACHCRTCRKQSSHFVAFSAAFRENFRLTVVDGLKWYRSGEQSERGFCKECGSYVLFSVDGADRISFSAGALDDDGGFWLGSHIFVSEKGSYYEIDDGRPQFYGGEGDLTVQAESPASTGDQAQSVLDKAEP